jgi:hypothetical protein
MKKVCNYCKKEFNGRKENKYCSRICRNKGRTVTEETRNKFSVFHSTRRRNPRSVETKQKISMAFTKDKEFIGFRKNELERLRRSEEYEKWRVSVYERDSYSCVLCHKIGGYLEAHHIKSFAKFPEVRFDINNGITVCKYCHSKIDKHRRIGEHNENK